MKVLLVALVLLPMGIFAQNIDYCTLKQIGDEKIFISKDEGTYEVLKNENGEEFNNILKALIFMEKENWEFVLSYAKCVKNVQKGGVIEVGRDYGCQGIENYFIFKKKGHENKP